MLFIGFCTVLIIAFILNLKAIDKINEEIKEEMGNKMEV